MSIVEKQKAFFNTHQTLSYDFRIDKLKRLKQSILLHQDDILDALASDLGKPQTEAILTEVWFTLHELNFTIKHLKKWMKPKRKKTTFFNKPGKSLVKTSPLGTTLIISPWNYPFQLTICPLIASIASGSTSVVKPSQYSPATTAIIKRILTETYEKSYIAFFEGGRKQATFLLEQNFDHIFFTGSTHVGKAVLEHASKHLTKTTLELGGKSPCIVDKTADIKKAAKRIAFGKAINSGQTCIAPDYIICDESIKDSLINALAIQFNTLYSGEFMQNPQYGKIITQQHFERITGLIQSEKIRYGGSSDPLQQKIAPTIVEASLHDAIMQEEIFGPVLPILTFQSLDDIIHIVNQNPNPLALYIFSRDKHLIENIHQKISFGGGCVNDVISHIVGSYLPFGGVKESGHGAYHGYQSYLTFSHQKSIYYKENWFDLKMKYPPYSNKFKTWIRKQFLPRS